MNMKVKEMAGIRDLPSFTLYQNVIGSLIGITLNLQIAFGSMGILTISIHEHDILFHLCVSSSISFFCVLYFSEYRYFIFLNFLLDCCFDAIVNGIVFLISSSD